MKQAKLAVSLTTLALLAAFLLAAGAAGRFGIGATAATGPSLMMFNPDTIYAVTTGNVLISFDSATPGTVSTIGPITGLQGGEMILAIDFRPANSQLYGLGSTSRLYTININTAAATAVSATPFTPSLSGTSFGIDFNPTVDRIRVVSDADQNLRLNPDTGAVAGSDTNLAYAPGDPNFGANPFVGGAAYTNNFNGATTTTLFDIDFGLDILVRQGGVDGNPSPNTGQLFTIGGLGILEAADPVGFDISSSGAAFASLTSIDMTISSFYAIDLTGGFATLIGVIGGGVIIRDIAVFPSCTINCPSSIGVSNDPGQCGANVFYPLPPTTGPCGTVTCSPVPGSFFHVGTTTITCMTQAGPSCSFPLTVFDTQPPTIDCPDNITVVGTLGSTCVVATFQPTATDNCPGVTTSCNPSSGFCFPLGTTTVTCTATDASGNTATCSFTVTAFDICLQDDFSSNILRINSQTGQYEFTNCQGVTLTGVGTVSRLGDVVLLQHFAADRIVNASVGGFPGFGTATITSFQLGRSFSITDSNTTNNTCSCP